MILFYPILIHIIEYYIILCCCGDIAVVQGLADDTYILLPEEKWQFLSVSYPRFSTTTDSYGS